MMGLYGKRLGDIGAIHAGDNEMTIGEFHTVLGFIYFPSWFASPSLSVSFLALDTMVNLM